MISQLIPRKKEFKDYSFVITKLLPAGELSACHIIDADISVDVKPLNEDQAREAVSLKRSLEQQSRIEGMNLAWTNEKSIELEGEITDKQILYYKVCLKKYFLCQ